MPRAFVRKLSVNRREKLVEYVQFIWFSANDNPIEDYTNEGLSKMFRIEQVADHYSVYRFGEHIATFYELKLAQEYVKYVKEINPIPSAVIFEGITYSFSSVKVDDILVYSRFLFNKSGKVIGNVLIEIKYDDLTDYIRL